VALVPCAGAGQRAGGGVPKQYTMLGSRPLVCHTLWALRQVPRIDATLVVLAPGDDAYERHVPASLHDRDWIVRCGGATRAASVFAGLAQLRERGVGEIDWVLVHDAARCLVQPHWIEQLIAACEGDPVGGLLALPVADTLKRADGEHRAAATIDRDGVWAAQTPQMFRLGLLERALAAGGPDVTDEAGAVEALGLRPLLVPGHWTNLKITWPGDLAVAERLLETVR
jgi:2-C-methyl-D-erythritol 4-phosphate cytidylyltransferase